MMPIDIYLESLRDSFGNFKLLKASPRTRSHSSRTWLTRTQSCTKS